MSEQISFNDLISDKKQRHAITPRVWECTKTCANFTNIYENGVADYFPGPGNIPRCVTPHIMTDWEEECVNNIWHCYCKCYRPKD